MNHPTPPYDLADYLVALAAILPGLVVIAVLFVALIVLLKVWH